MLVIVGIFPIYLSLSSKILKDGADAVHTPIEISGSEESQTKAKSMIEELTSLSGFTNKMAGEIISVVKWWWKWRYESALFYSCFSFIYNRYIYSNKWKVWYKRNYIVMLYRRASCAEDRGCVTAPLSTLFKKLVGKTGILFGGLISLFGEIFLNLLIVCLLLFYKVLQQFQE